MPNPPKIHRDLESLVMTGEPSLSALHILTFEGSAHLSWPPSLPHRRPPKQQHNRKQLAHRPTQTQLATGRQTGEQILIRESSSSA